MRRWMGAGLVAVAVLMVPATAGAQPGMPDPGQMSGIPRPVDDLPDGAVSVLLLRGSFSNPVTNHDVELLAGGTTQKEKTDAEGRVIFGGLKTGSMARVSALIDGETLTSQEFAVPSRGGVRLMLVASAGDAKSDAAAPAATGEVILGGQSRIIIEPGDESIQLFYLLDITNPTTTPVNPPSVFMLDMPTGAVGTTVLEGSSPLASVNGTRLRVQGPFPPGVTLVQVACELPVYSGTLAFTQTFPVKLEQLNVVATRMPGMRLVSPQLVSQQDVTTQGQNFISGTGAEVAAGQPVAIALEGLPHHSTVPRSVAFVIALIIVAGGAWATTAAAKGEPQSVERRELAARRERLFSELVRLENQQRAGRVDQARYTARRGEIVATLELIYGALDSGEGDTSSESRKAATA